MTLTKQQLETILDRALPGERLREWRALPDDRYALAVAGGERLNVQVYGFGRAGCHGGGGAAAAARRGRSADPAAARQ